MMSVAMDFEGEELWFNLLDGFRIWGNEPWDEGGWEVQEGFAKKWWFMLGEGLGKRTNWWRRLRGEGELVFRDFEELEIRADNIVSEVIY